MDHIGYLPQNFDVFPELTAYEVLQFFANLKGYKITEAEIDHLLEILNLSPQRDMTVKTLSGGMKRRLGIAQALIGDRMCCCWTNLRRDWTGGTAEF